MHINLVLIPFVIILGLLISANDSKRNRSVYIIICSVVFLLIGSLRSPEWMTYVYGIDTLNYKDKFEDSFYMSWGEFWQVLHSRYSLHDSEDDIGFIAFNKLIGLFTHSFQIYSLLADLFFFVPFGILLYRYSTNIIQLIFAFVFYIALVQVFLFGGARQIFAIGFDLMALLAITDKRIVRALLCFLIGVSIHFSSILFFIPLVMNWIDVKPQYLKLIHGLCFIVFPIVLLFPNELIVFMGNVLGMEKYAHYGEGEIRGGANTFITLVEALSLYCFVAIKKSDLDNNRTLRIFYVMAPLFTVFAPLIHSHGAMIRVSLYYHLFLSLLVPMAIECMFKERINKGVVYFVSIAALAFWVLSGDGVVYYFFWQH